MGIRKTCVAMAATLTVTLALGACGGGDDDDGGGGESAATTPAATVPAATPPAATTPESTTTTAAKPGTGSTEPGAELTIGDTAHVTRKPLDDTFENETTYEMDVTVLEIEKGSIDHFKGMSLDEGQKQSTPYYVKVRLTSTGDAALPADDDPDLGIEAIDDRGQEQPSITFIGDFDRCDDKKPPKAFKGGRSYETCLAFLAGRGGSIVEARWTGASDYVIDPVVWK